MLMQLNFNKTYYNMLTFTLSAPVVDQLLRLQAVEEGRMGNYTLVDKQLDKIRYRVADLVMASVLREIRNQQFNQPTNEE